MFIQVMKKQEQEEKQKARNGGASGLNTVSGSGTAPNPNYEPGGGGKGLDETTVYHNTSYGPDENPNEGLEEIIEEEFDRG